MAALNKTALLKQLFQSFTTGIRNFRAIQPRVWLERKGLDYNELEIGFNSGQFSHRKNQEFKDQYVQIGVLKVSDAPVKSPELKAYTCFGTYAIVFPLKNEHGEIVNLYAIGIKKEKKEYLYSTGGFYPRFPAPFTQRLFLTDDVLSAATILQSKLLENRDAMLALKDGELTKKHISAMEQLKHLRQIILINKPWSEELQSQFPSIHFSQVKTPDKESVNDFFLKYGSEGLLQLIEEGAGSNIKKSNTDTLQPTSEIEGENPALNSLLVHSQQKIGFAGQAGDYLVLGNLPFDLSSMRVTLQLEDPGSGRKHIHKLDLYEAEEVTDFILEISEKHNFNGNLVETDLRVLTLLLGEYRDKLVEKSDAQLIGKRTRQILSPEKENEAVKFLSEKKLVLRIDELIARSGVIGEENNRILLFICSSTYKTNPLHVLVQGTSGSGKSHLINAIKDCFPAEDVINLTRVTSKSFYHYQGDELMNKLIVIQDFDGLDEEAQLAFREAQSAKQLSTSTVRKDRMGNLQSIVRSVNAHFSSLMATTQAEVYYDNMSRSVVIGVDESEQQTRNIISYQNKKISGLIDFDGEQQARELLQNCIRVLKPYKVINRFADKVHLPIEAKMLRRLNEQFQMFVAQVAFLHQFQREIDEQGRVVATVEDVKTAVELFFDAIMLKVDELDCATRQFFERMKEAVNKKGAEKKFTQREIRQQLNQSKTQCFRYFETLLRLEYISVTEGTANRGFIYKINEWRAMKEIREKIKKELYAQMQDLG